MIAPLLYNEVLPSLRPISVLPPYRLVEPSPDMIPVSSTAAPSRTSFSLAKPWVYKPPTNSSVDHASTVIRDEGGIPVSGGDGVPAGLQMGGSARMSITDAAAPQPVAKPVVATPKPPSKPVQVGGDVQAAKLIRKIVPVYPRMAVIARISGIVRLQGIIGKDGSIQQLQVLSGPPLLINAALDAVRQWRYQPTLLNGEPVEVISPIDVIFKLSQ